MLAEVGIENFKAFADGGGQVIFRPLTLIYGANSAGKSSVLHALLLAKHAAQTGELDVDRPEASGESVDLGGFRNFVHRHQVGRKLRLTLRPDLGKTAYQHSQGLDLLSNLADCRVRLTVGCKTDDRERVIEEGPYLLSYEVLTGEVAALQMSRRPTGRLALDVCDIGDNPLGTLFRSLVESQRLAPEPLSPEERDQLAIFVARRVPDVTAGVNGILPRSIDYGKAMDAARARYMITGNKPAGTDSLESLSEIVDVALPWVLESLVMELASRVRDSLAVLRYLGPLRTYPDRHFAFARKNDPNWEAGGGAAWDRVRRDASVREAVNAWLADPKRLSSPYRLEVRQLVAMEDLREPLESTLEDIDESHLAIDIDADEEPDACIEHAEIEDVDAEIKDFYRNVRKSGLETVPELVLVQKSADGKADLPVSHRDIGVGISQVLPVLVQALGHERSMLAIEQPEIHLHPQLQAELGDVFIESTLGTRRNCFVVETHSEHILLRVMRRMRETHESRLPAGASPVKPADVSVLFVERDGPRSIIREMPLNERGELVKAWPGGFFEEGLREVFA